MRRSKQIAQLQPRELRVFQLFLFFFFSSTWLLQNTAELHPFVIPCGILVLFCHVILIFLPLLCASVKHVFVCLHCSPSSPGPRYTQDFRFGRQTACAQQRQRQQQSGVLSWDELCSSGGEGCSLLTEGRNGGSKRQQKAGVGERQKKKKQRQRKSVKRGRPWQIRIKRNVWKKQRDKWKEKGKYFTRTTHVSDMKRRTEPWKSRKTAKRQRERQDNEQNTEERGQREDDKAKKTCLMDAGMEKGMTETGKERWIDSGWKEK